MQVQFYKTRNKLLKPYIEGFYFLSKSRETDPVEYLTFPNNLINVSIYKNVGVKLNNSAATIFEDKEISFTSVLISNYKSPIKVSFLGEIDEITVCFKPLGLNSFLPQVSPYLNDELNSFIPFDDYVEKMEVILNEANAIKKSNFIEAYWLPKINDFKNSMLSAMIFDLSSAEIELSISDLAIKYNTSRQNINKLFKRYLGKNPAEFKKINRFRLSLSKRIASLKAKQNLTNLSYESFFYDQSHMIKEFKMLTGLSPKQFFEQVNLKSGAGTWLFAK